MKNRISIICISQIYLSLQNEKELDFGIGIQILKPQVEEKACAANEKKAR